MNNEHTPKEAETTELAEFNAKFWDLLTQNGEVVMSAKQQRDLGESICKAGEVLAKASRASQRTKDMETIRERLKKQVIEINYQLPVPDVLLTNHDVNRSYNAGISIALCIIESIMSNQENV